MAKVFPKFDNTTDPCKWTKSKHKKPEKFLTKAYYDQTVKKGRRSTEEAKGSATCE